MNWIEKAEQCFGGMSVRRKLTLMSFGISVVVSLLSSAAFYFFLVAQLEETITEDVEAVAEMTAHNVTVAIAFGDAEVADEVLGALAAKRLVTAAYILTGSEGTDVFSRYGAGDLAAVSKDGISGWIRRGVSGSTRGLFLSGAPMLQIWFSSLMWRLLRAPSFPSFAAC